MKHRLASAGTLLLPTLVVFSLGVGTAQAPKRTPQLVIAQLGNPTALDGWNWAATSEQDILGHIQETPLEYDRQAKLQPILAEGVEMTSPAEWSIKIRYTLDREIGEAIAGYWEAAGLKVDYKPQDFAVLSPKVLGGSPAWPTNP